MAVLVISNSALMKLLWAGPNRQWINVLGLVATGSMPVIDQAFANSMFTTLAPFFTTSGMATLMPPTVSFTGVSVRNISVANQAEFTSAGAPVAGAGTGDPLPLNVAACISFKTALAGKSFRGRAYISGFNELQNDSNGRVSAAANAAAVSFLQAVHDSMPPLGFNMAVLSRPGDARTIPERVIAGKGGFATPINLIQARNTKWESQRRRTGRT